MSNHITDNNIDADSFQAIAQLTYKESGLQLAVEKTSMIQSRLRHRLHALSLADFKEYTAFVCSDKGREERRHMISALTTNVSHFFREKHHFAILEKHIENVLLPTIKAGNSVRMWSAGCSNGQEALSIAMTLLGIIPKAADFDIRILATDIDSKVVQFARNSLYPERLISGIPTNLLEKFFVKKVADGEVLFEASDSLRKLITFQELNLLSEWPMKQKFDVIFCRNVVIYFDVETQNTLWPRFHEILKNDGYLFLGHSERVADPQLVGFQPDGPTTYKPSS